LRPVGPVNPGAKSVLNPILQSVVDSVEGAGVGNSRLLRLPLAYDLPTECGIMPLLGRRDSRRSHIGFCERKILRVGGLRNR